MKRKLWFCSIVTVLSLSSAFSSLAMELKTHSASYQMNDMWKTIEVSQYWQDGLEDGWYEEDGKTFYIINGSPVSIRHKVDGKIYYFNEDGSLLKEDSQEYLNLISLISEMHNAKIQNDPTWNYDCSAMTDYQKYALLYTYCKQYIPASYDLGDSGFKFDGNYLMLDITNPRYDVEKITDDFLQDFPISDDMSDERKIRIIHDKIAEIFSYDYSYSNMSDDLKEALKHNNKIVCGGYAGIFKLVCENFGLESEIITGMGNGELHAWNKVKANGEWKYIDCCWDDTSNSHTWFLKSKEYFDQTHHEG
ncbi:transglutaminase domain-containing protein [Hungatella hathewayi]|uniref:transglutaminase domain-containing protein n=1 Tax=Hungatella hathewayi TaxID=154046 RepID=UPI003561E5FC